MSLVEELLVLEEEATGAAAGGSVSSAGVTEGDLLPPRLSIEYVTFLTTLWPLSQKKTLPSASTATPCGWHNNASVAFLPSPPYSNDGQVLLGDTPPPTKVVITPVLFVILRMRLLLKSE